MKYYLLSFIIIVIDQISKYLTQKVAMIGLPFEVSKFRASPFSSEKPYSRSTIHKRGF